MAKIEFTAEEIAVLKKAATEAQKAGAEKAKAIIRESGVEFSVSSEVKTLLTPEANSLVGDNNCYACVACMLISIVVMLTHTKD